MHVQTTITYCWLFKMFFWLHNNLLWIIQLTDGLLGHDHCVVLFHRVLCLHQSVRTFHICVARVSPIYIVQFSNKLKRVEMFWWFRLVMREIEYERSINTETSDVRSTHSLRVASSCSIEEWRLLLKNVMVWTQLLKDVGKFCSFFACGVFCVYSVHTVTSWRVPSSTSRTWTTEMSAEGSWCHTKLDLCWQQKTTSYTSKAVKGRTVCNDVYLMYLLSAWDCNKPCFLAAMFWPTALYMSVKSFIRLTRKLY